MHGVRTLLASITSGVAGAASAVALMLVVGAPPERAVQRTEAAQPREARSQRPAPREVTGWAEDARLTRVERELEGLVAHGEPTPLPSAVVEDAAPPPDADELLEHAEHAWQDAVAAHGDERTDTAWAAEVQTILGEDLTQVVGPSAERIDVDCRSESCLASVEFSSFEEATTAFATLLDAPYRINCGVSVAAPEPDDPTASYATEILFSCGEAEG